MFLACVLHPATSICFLGGCSGATTIKVDPKSVSGRVVKTRRPETGDWRLVLTLSCDLYPVSCILTLISAPMDFPIQFCCINFIDSLQSKRSRSFKSLSAYLVIFNIHWRKSFFTTWCPQRSQFPSLTSSFARPVLKESHQLIGMISSYASPFF